MGLGSGFERADEISEKKRVNGRKKGSSICAKLYIYPQFFFPPPTAPVDRLEGAVFLSFDCLYRAVGHCEQSGCAETKILVFILILILDPISSPSRPLLALSQSWQLVFFSFFQGSG